MIKQDSINKEYSDYYFAFIDILGFKEIVKTKTCAEIIEIFEEAKKEYIVSERKEEMDTPVIPSEEIHYYVMSDSICIFIRENMKSALSILSFICMYFQVRMLCLSTPVLVRGSIVKGKIYADSNVLFGPAMVEAYVRSEKLAHVPRIILTENLYEELSGTDGIILSGIAHLESDGFYALSYIDYFCRHNSTSQYRQKVQQLIESAINASLDQTVREKYLYVKSWMDYHQRQKNSNDANA